jgi:putative spermidine/putrescine transport system substrate-binding protein
MQSKRIWMAALAATAALVLSATATARDLTVVSWGGAYQDAQREVYFKPFMETSKIKMAEENWDGGVGTLRAKVQGGNNNWDVVQVESEELLIGCEEGLYEKLDWAKLGGKDKFLPDAVNDCGVGAIVYSFILATRSKATRQSPGPTSGTPRNGQASARCARGRRRRWKSPSWPTASRRKTSTRRSGPAMVWSAHSRSSIS